MKPRKSFTEHLRYLSKLDPTIVDEVKDAIDILLNGETLPDEFQDHDSVRKLSGYSKFHLRDTPKGERPPETNNVVIIYKIEFQDLILVAVDIGSHLKMFSHENQKKKYRKPRNNEKE
ncbi:mRNA interferase YafQ [Lactobacillus colini]|uniref:mRNA interferase YafQ n=1 Tax=Lactobacillus colini TaxID=1819254 RepID=A0ABS4MCK4_9LACO|nr:type II toxin-antitoxin system YafQ family toxin [Lactobacillus colini]MBP2057414.1 mRNA interferase YafQ [Lactobacillus colini]